MLPIIPSICSLSLILDDAAVDSSWLAIGTRDRSTRNSLELGTQALLAS